METAAFSSSTRALRSLTGFPGSRRRRDDHALPATLSGRKKKSNTLDDLVGVPLAGVQSREGVCVKPWLFGECRTLIHSRSPRISSSPLPFTLCVRHTHNQSEKRKKAMTVVMMFCSSVSVGVSDTNPFAFSGTFKWSIHANSKTLASRSSRWHQFMQSSCRIMSASCQGRSGDFFPDEFGPYPWDPVWNTSDNEAIDWIQDDIVTLFTTDGLIQIGGSLIPHQPSAAERRQSRGKFPYRFRRFREEDYMDPKQGLCLGASFDIVATNGLDTGRRFCVFGFCRSIEMLSDMVEDTVLEQGGEVVVAAKGGNGGLNEKLSMKVAVPLLWGVPPAVDLLNYAIRCGGGIVEKISCQWEFL